MAGLFPLSRQIQFDASGNVAPGARLNLYDGGTSTPRVGYRDLALTSEHPAVILADAGGRLPLIYLADGYYRQRLTTSTGEAIFDDDGIPVLSTSAGGAGTSVDPESIYKTGNVKIDFGTGVIDGYVRVNGRTIGSAASGATERANSDTEPLYAKLWAFANITVAAGKGADAASDFAANKPLTRPNGQGGLRAGIPDMGGTADSAFAALLTGTTTQPNATGGADTVTLLQANLPAVTLTGGSGTISGTTGTESQSHSHAVTDPGHTHLASAGNVFAGSGSTGIGTGGSGPGGSASDLAGVNTSSTTTGITLGNASQTHTHSVTGTASSVSVSLGGSATAVNKLPSLLTVTFYLRL